MARAEHMGEHLKSRLPALRHSFPHISDVRGLGVMLAMELAQADGTPDAAFTKQVVRASDAGLLLLTCGVHTNVISFLFALTIEDASLDEGLDLLAMALKN